MTSIVEITKPANNTVEVNSNAPLTVELNPSTGIVGVSPIQPIVEINVTAPGGFSGGLGVEPFQFSRPGNAYVSTGGVPVILDGNYTLESYTVACGTAPTGAAIIFDINKNDVSLFTTQANRPTIPAGQTVGSTTLPDIKTFVPGDKLTIDIDQIGSTLPGQNVEINLRLRRTS